SASGSEVVEIEVSDEVVRVVVMGVVGFGWGWTRGVGWRFAPGLGGRVGVREGCSETEIRLAHLGVTGIRRSAQCAHHLRGRNGRRHHRTNRAILEDYGTENRKVSAPDD